MRVGTAEERKGAAVERRLIIFVALVVGESTLSTGGPRGGWGRLGGAKVSDETVEVKYVVSNRSMGAEEAERAGKGTGEITVVGGKQVSAVDLGLAGRNGEREGEGAHGSGAALGVEESLVRIVLGILGVMLSILPVDLLPAHVVIVLSFVWRGRDVSRIIIRRIQDDFGVEIPRDIVHGPAEGARRYGL